MSRLLHVIANPKSPEGSVSRRLAGEFLALRRHAHPEEWIETLDLYLEDVPVLDAVTAEIVARPPDRPGMPPVIPEDELPPSWALAASNRFSAQFVRADRVVITTPMWNFGPPAILKSWVDLIVRQGQTFAFTDDGIRPLAPGKSILVIGSRGGLYSGESPLCGLDFLEPWLRGLFGMLGAKRIEAVWAEGMTYPQSAEARESLETARQRLKDLVESF